MCSKYLICIFCACLLHLIARAIGDNTDEECRHTYELVFEGRNQPKLLAQETISRIIWMRYSCFLDDSDIQSRLSYYSGFAELYEKNCRLEYFEEMHKAEGEVTADTNIARFLLIYNQIQYEACRPIMFDELFLKSKDFNPELNKFCVLSGIFQNKLAEILAADNVSFDRDELRKKTAFQLVEKEGNLSFMEKNLPFFVRRKMLFNEFDRVVGVRCKKLLELIEHSALGLIKLHRLTIRAPRLHNPWIRSYLFCKTSLDNLTIWNIDEEWEKSKRFPNVDPELIKSIEELPISHVVGVNLGDNEVGAVDPSSDKDAVSITKKHKILTKTRNPSLKLEEIERLMMDLMLFYEKWSMKKEFFQIRRYHNFAAVGLSHCRVNVIKTRAEMVKILSDSNIKRYASFYNNFQYELCLNFCQSRMWTLYQVERNQELRQFVSRLSSLSYATFKLASSSEPRGDYRLHAAIEYLIKYANLQSLPKKNQRRIFELYLNEVKKPCDELLAKLKHEIEITNMVLEVLDPTKRAAILFKGVKYILSGAKVCRFLIQEAKEQKLHKAYKRVEALHGEKGLIEDPEVASNQADLTEVDFFFEPDFNAEVELIFALSDKFEHDLTIHPYRVVSSASLFQN